MSKLHWGLFAAILLFGVVFRFVLLGRSSYMIDEINVIRDAVNQPSYSAIVKTELERFTWYHRLPMLMMVIRLFAKPFAPAGGFPPEWTARLPFALMGMAALPVFFLLGRTLRNVRTGLWAMFLCSFSIYHVYYSREAYDYSMIIFFASLVLWTGMEMLRNWDLPGRKFVRWAAGYALVAVLFLQSHLSCLLFLAPFNALLVLTLLWNEGVGGTFRGRNLKYLAPALLIPYFAFIPFLFRLFGGYTSTDASATTIYFTWASVPALLGRMGWGQALFAMIPFVAFLLLGICAGLRGSDRKSVRMYIMLTGALLAYGILQSIMLNRSQSRFEIRYYSPFFPILMLFAAAGVTWLADRFGNARRNVTSAVIALILVLWSLPSLANVCLLKCRGYNYKGIAQWINSNLPDNGIYAFYNVYELRGVPAVYPTPGRFGTSAAVWSSQEDFDRVNPPQRVFSLFSRFPLAAFIEIGPADILAPEMNQPVIDRERLFANQVWLDDPAWSRLLKWKTFPPGEVQMNSENMSRVLISWNRPEDLPELARRRNQAYYQHFGPQWGYVRDQQYNDWRHIRTGEKADIIIGNTGSENIRTDLHIQIWAPPSGCLISFSDESGKAISGSMKAEASPQAVTVPGVELVPGISRLQIRATPVSPLVPGNLLVYEVRAVPSAISEERIQDQK